jgi:hypothetical protein
LLKRKRWLILTGVVICLAALLIPAGCGEDEAETGPTATPMQVFEWNFSNNGAAWNGIL